MKTVVAGSRTFHDFSFVEIYLNFYHKIVQITEVVSGGAHGVDALGEQWAQKHNIPVNRFPADWKKYGKAAGPISNKKMAEYADVFIGFWNITFKIFDDN